MSIVYTVTYSQAIQANVTIESKEIDVDETAIFDARASYFANYEELGVRALPGIVYSWKCPDPFTAYCASWYNSPVLEITPTAFANLGGAMQRDYTFTVQTWSVEAGLEPANVFESSVRVQWKNLQAPDFDLVVPQEA